MDRSGPYVSGGDNMNKRIFAIMAAAAILSTASCSRVMPSDNRSEPVTAPAAETTAAETVTGTTAVAIPLMPPMTEPYQYFEGFDVSGSVRSVFNGSDNTIAVQADDYETGMSSCYVFDPVSDKMIRSIQLPDTNYRLRGMFSNGTVIVEKMAEKPTLHMYPEGSSKPVEIIISSDYYADFTVDMMNDLVYWYDRDEKSIMQVNDSGKISKYMSCDRYWDFCQFSYDGEMFFEAAEISENTLDGIERGIYSLSDGSRITGVPVGTGSIVFTKDNVTAVRFDLDANGEGSSTYLSVADKNSGKAEKAYRLPLDQFANLEFKGSSKSDHGIAISYNSGMFSDFRDVYLMDFKKGMAVNTGIELSSDVQNISCCYSENIGRWFIGLTRTGNSNGSRSLLMLDPDMFEFDTELESSEVWKNDDHEFTKAGEGFSQIRKEADKIESEFGVRILVGDEVMNSEKYSQYSFISTEENTDSYVIENEMNNVMELRKTLSLYPKGFFRHFRTNGKCGLRIALVADFDIQDPFRFHPLGVSYNTGGWYDIAVNSSTMYEYGGTLHHEIWHSAEQLVGKRFGEIDEKEWKKLDPEGFDYYYDFDSYASGDRSDGKAPLLLTDVYQIEKNYDIPYFISDYSLLTPMEDRATIIEQMFQWYYDEETDEMYMVGEDELRKYPHLAAKLDFLADWSEKEFGCVYWEEMLRNMEKAAA